MSGNNKQTGPYQGLQDETFESEPHSPTHSGANDIHGGSGLAYPHENVGEYQSSKKPGKQTIVVDKQRYAPNDDDANDNRNAGMVELVEMTSHSEDTKEAHENDDTQEDHKDNPEINDNPFIELKRRKKQRQHHQVVNSSTEESTIDGSNGGFPFDSSPEPSGEEQIHVEQNDRYLYVNRTLWSDLFQTYLNGFINFAMKRDKITEDNLLYLQEKDKTANCYSEWCTGDNNNIIVNNDIHLVIKRLTIVGIAKYSLQLISVEISTIISIYLIRVIIDYLQKSGNPAGNESSFPWWYSYLIFAAFCFFRLVAIVMRNYYDLHVYNYFRYVENAIKAWLYHDVQRVKVWQMQESKRAAILNILTKDIEAFVNGSWQFPYLVVVPVNTIISIIILQSMFGQVILISYIAMVGLLALQYFSNKKIADLQYQLKKQTDSRIQYISQVLLGIKQIKCRVLESVFAERIGIVRAKEIQQFSQFVNIKNICAAIYANAGVIISSLIFLCADSALLELGKVFSTLALLGYIFNFSIVYSNYAIEALYQLKVFNQRVRDVVENMLQKQNQSEKQFEAVTYDGNSNEAAISLEGVYVQWNILQEDKDTGEDIESQAAADGMTDTVLKDITFSFQNGEKVAVIGKVGSGKTSLFLTILKELCIVKGRLHVSQRSHIAYAEQNPLIMSGTVRSNILFGEKYDAQRYQQVVKACALDSDFEQLANNDLTKLGEMGTQLSGGQKSRISLARALYKRDSKIILIDGSLSALDSRVARHIMDNAIKGELCKDKIILMVTYDLDQAAEMDLVMHIENGMIAHLKKSDEFFNQNQVVARLRQEISRAPRNSNSEERQSEKGSAGEKKTQIIKDSDKEASALKVTWETYKTYFGYSKCGILSLFLIVFYHLIINLNSMAVGFYLAFTLSHKFTEESLQNPASYNIALIIIMVSSILSSFCCKYLSNRIFMEINQKVHDIMVQNVLQAKVKFFEENTQGMILNRFSKDVQTLDKIIFTFLEVTDQIVKCSITLVIIVATCPWVLLISVLSFFMLIRLRAINLHCTRDTYALKAGLMSPINSLIQDTLNGLPTIKAFQKESHFLNRLFELSDSQTSAHITSSAVNRWTAFRIDLQAYLIASFFAGFSLFVVSSNSAQALAMTAIGFQLATEIARHLNMAVRWTATVEIDMINIQRLLKYVALKPEQTQEQLRVMSSEEKHLKGQIEFHNVEMRYSKKLRPALSELTFNIQKGEKVSVVGRTGSGKSSMFQLLQGFRPPSNGDIIIDGNNIRSFKLPNLRKQIEVVLQQAFIISNYSIRDNMDPEHKYSDSDIVTALNKACLGDFSPLQLTSSLSTGQIQLLSIAQAFLAKPPAKLLLLDEPTSQIDGVTQKKVLRELFIHFRESTVLMIAHRLETAVAFTDKILVLDQGRMVQFDHPYRLLAERIEDVEITKRDSIFAQMVLALNETQQQRVFDKAKKRYLK